MAQDLRDLFEEERNKKTFTMPKGHEDRFLERLESELPIEKIRSNTHWWRIAASVIVVLGIGAFFYLQNRDKAQPETTLVDTTDNKGQKTNISLGDLSPDLQKLETYYTANINLELASIEVSDENKELIDGYMEQLAELGQEYSLLLEELNNIGPNDQTIEALIKNFQLQLSLLQKLKSKLNQFKSSKNEQQSNII